MAKRKFSTFNIICLTLLWLILIYLIITRSAINFMTVFIIVVSSILIFVPIYKSKKREKDNR